MTAVAMANTTIIERIADPLPGGRAQLVETCFDYDEHGRGTQEYTVRRGSPAAMATVREHEEVLTFTDAGVSRRRP